MAYHEVKSICKAGDELFVLASNGLYQYNINDQSITTYDKVNGLSDTHITHIAWSQQAKRLIAVYQNANIDLIETDGDIINISALYNKSMTDNKTVNSISIEGIYAYLHCSFGIVKVNMQKAEITDTYTPNMPDYPVGLTPYQDQYAEYITMVSTLNPGGPIYNHFYESKFIKGILYTTGGYFLPSMPDNEFPGIIQTFDGNNWTLFEENINEKTGYAYLDICCIDVDPINEKHVFAGGRCGLYEFNDGKLVAYYNKDNSPLKSANDRGTELGNDYLLILGIKFDAQGNLWVLNSMAQGVSLLELTPDHQWKDHHQPLLTDNTENTLPGLRDMTIDSRGLLWFVNNNWQNAALFCYDMQNDVLLKYDNFTNQDGQKYNITWAYCVVEDRENNIWIGTDQGPFMIKKSEVGQQNITFQQIKVPRNDGTSYADYLLSGVSISSIAIDGGNRKWFGTNGSGVFLISSDNLNQLQSFTTSNSKLISDNITSVIVNQQSGEVFFLSDKGLCSFYSDAIEPNEEMTKDNVWAYPNPVSPDYTGLITITGLSFDADVKIIASNGALIAEGRSNGGLFTWNGCDKKGKRVASGVYMVITANSDGKKGTVCKIAIIK
ncbi:two-component regulator propeller domain-containing protein [Prevotella sp. khp7]|uniref:type IX secretion system anionic LPS delivery protein PorZ n=1 Tax=Prevotella sp. khp7 TaxID=1761885 RepID=UPI00210190D8|nr:two-component regulator propeller domain-containing protein [Prevotella sp. khp7]